MDLKIQELSKNYEKTVLRSIDLDLSGYKTIAIIGKSGCGKSTLLRILTGIEEADSGQVTVNGMLLEDRKLKSYQESIGMVFQQHNLFPHLTLLENITLILEKVRGVDKEKAEAVATKLLIQLHLDDELGKRPRFVSGGQAQRASIARALSTNPEVVFMDEPTAALDPILTKEVLDAVSELKSTGTEFVFVTHEISFVRDFAEYVIFMEDGIIEEHGQVDILNNPKSESLRLFLENERR